MAVRKRGKVWYFDFMIRRVRYRGALPEARTKAQAEEAECQERHAVFEGRYGRPTGRAVFIDYAKGSYLAWAKENKRSWRSDKYTIDMFASHFGRRTFAEMTPLLIEKFKRDRRATRSMRGERALASINRELACLSKIFSMAVRDRLTVSNPVLEIRKYRETNERTRYLSVEEERRLLAACTGRKAHLVPIIVLAINTGMRRGEILKLRWPQVDFDRGMIRLGSAVTKTSRPRDIPMNEAVREQLIGLFKSRTSDLVVSNPHTGKVIVNFKTAFHRACQDAGISGLRFHDLRHTFGTRAADMGVDPFTIAELLGHADLRMTKRYTHATDQRKRQAVESLSDYAKSGSDCLKFVSKGKREAG